MEFDLKVDCKPGLSNRAS